LSSAAEIIVLRIPWSSVYLACQLTAESGDSYSKDYFLFVRFRIHSAHTCPLKGVACGPESHPDADPLRRCHFSETPIIGLLAAGEVSLICMAPPVCRSFFTRN